MANTPSMRAGILPCPSAARHAGKKDKAAAVHPTAAAAAGTLHTPMSRESWKVSSTGSSEPNQSTNQPINQSIYHHVFSRHYVRYYVYCCIPAFRRGGISMFYSSVPCSYIPECFRVLQTHAACCMIQPSTNHIPMPVFVQIILAYFVLCFFTADKD